MRNDIAAAVAEILALEIIRDPGQGSALQRALEDVGEGVAARLEGLGLGTASIAAGVVLAVRMAAGLEVAASESGRARAGFQSSSRRGPGRQRGTVL